MGVGAAIVGASLIGAYGSKKAADSQSKSASNSITEQRRQFDLQYADQAPYRQTGVNALAEIDKLRGGDYSNFMASPSYQFNLDQGLKAVDRLGGGLSGAAVKSGAEYASGLASREFGNYYNRLAGQAGIGQTSVGQTGQLGAQTAGNIGNAMISQGNARANAYQGYNQAIQGGIQNYMLNSYLNQPSGYSGQYQNSLTRYNGPNYSGYAG